MAPCTTAGDDAGRSDDARPNPASPADLRLTHYGEAKDSFAAALDAYLRAVVGLGNDPATSLELARAMLEHDVNTAVDQLVLTVPLTAVWAELVRTGGRADRG